MAANYTLKRLSLYIVSVDSNSTMSICLQMFSEMPANHIMASHRRELVSQQQEKATSAAAHKATSAAAHKPTKFSTGIRMVCVLSAYRTVGGMLSSKCITIKLCQDLHKMEIPNCAFSLFLSS